MAKRRGQSDDGVEIGAWIVTFSDCMTLLLCFFVLLLTFSSFDEASLKKLQGLFDKMEVDSFEEERNTKKDSFIEPVKRLVDWTDQGSEKPKETDKLLGRAETTARILFRPSWVELGASESVGWAPPD